MTKTTYRELKANVVYIVHSGKCVLHDIAYGVGAQGCVLTVYDNTADSGEKVLELTVSNDDPGGVSLDLGLRNGMCVKATEDVSIVYTLTTNN